MERQNFSHAAIYHFFNINIFCLYNKHTHVIKGKNFFYDLLLTVALKYDYMFKKRFSYTIIQNQ